MLLSFIATELQRTFLDMVQDLPDEWRQAHDELLQDLERERNREGKELMPKTPIRVLANATSDMDIDPNSRPYFDDPHALPQASGMFLLDCICTHLYLCLFEYLCMDVFLRNYVLFGVDTVPSNTGSRRPSTSSLTVAAQQQQQQQQLQQQQQPWSSPSLRASPTDQLIAAILDGDVQGIRAIVRSKGDDLQSEFWHDLARSVLPLHRAIAGLHFHGSEKLLIATMEVLIQLGTDVNAVDHAGNNALHKAIPVCTSKSVVSVVKCLLQKGANPSMFNKEGDSPLHTECKR
jgi:hypothetical protein